MLKGNLYNETTKDIDIQDLSFLTSSSAGSPHLAIHSAKEKLLSIDPISRLVS